MHTIANAQVKAFRPTDLLRHVTGDRPHTVVSSGDEKICVEFAYDVSNDYTWDSGQHHEFTPVLNSKSVKKLVEMGAVRWEHVDTDTTIIGVLDCDGGGDEQHVLHFDLKEAFFAHDRYDFGGKDPRRVWNDYVEKLEEVGEEVPEVADYFG